MNMEGKIAGQCKVRKRGSRSSSSSSSLVKNYRLKRAILVGKRGGGSSTPVPMWKTSSSRTPPLMKNLENKTFKFLAANGGGGDKGRDFSVSARKLAATLWEINGVHAPKVKDNLEDKKCEFELRKKDKILKALQFSDPCFSPVSERMVQSKEGSHRRRGSVGSQKLLMAECNQEGFVDTLQNACRTEADHAIPHRLTVSGHVTRVKKRLKDVRDGLRTSKELLKVLNKLWGMEEHNSTCVSLFSALKAELDHACIQVNKLIQQERSSGAEIDMLLKQLEEEKAVRKVKEQNRIHSAITSIAGELETEKKLRRQTERLNKKLGRELADTKATLSRATKELESEKRAREMLEQVCDELARGIGEDRAEVEELKRQSAKVREEVEKEREMLQLADILREERVQMKLSEAKFEFEEKSAIVDRLRTELEAYLKTKVSEDQVNASPNFERIKELERYLRETLPNTSPYQEDKPKEGDQAANEDDQEDDDDDDSADSDLHSIELNVDDDNKTYEWTNGGSKRKPLDEKQKGRKSTSERNQRQSISLERLTSDGIEWEFSPTRSEDRGGVFDRKKLFEFSSGEWRKDCDDEIERYNMIKDLRDHIAASSNGFVSPTKKWKQQTLPSQNTNKMMMSQNVTLLQEAI